ncbi:MAG: class I SAM-dependent methyltransferase [Verrucomicrobiae bacterium]|nr:class I SAM-dependent methyltransferase [Verrucomicrobiae bacterium]
MPPLPDSTQDLSSHYDNRYYQERGFLDSSITNYSRKEKLFNLAWASKWSGKDLFDGHQQTALDAGCGVGHNSFILNEFGYRTKGVDHSIEAISAAKKRAVAEQRENMEWNIVNLDRDSLAGSFDLILCWEVIEHVQNPVATLRQLYEALNPGGVLIITTPNRLGLSYLLLDRDPTHIHVHSSFWWARQLRLLRPAKWICRALIFWDHVFPCLHKWPQVMAHWLPILGFRVRIAVVKSRMPQPLTGLASSACHTCVD